MKNNNNSKIQKPTKQLAGELIFWLTSLSFLSFLFLIMFETEAVDAFKNTFYVFSGIILGVTLVFAISNFLSYKNDSNFIFFISKIISLVFLVIIISVLSIMFYVYFLDQSIVINKIWLFLTLTFLLFDALIITLFITVPDKRRKKSGNNAKNYSINEIPTDKDFEEKRW